MNIRKQLLSVFGVSLVLTIVLSGYFISFSGNVATGLDDLNAYQEATADALEEFREVELALLNDAWEMKYLDESLSHTIARYIQSDGQNYWNLRYEEQTDDLAASFESAKEKATAEDYAVVENVKAAQKIMSEYDTQIRALVAEGALLKDTDAKAAKFAKAKDMLYGDYEIQKAIYAGGMRDFFNAQQKRLDDSIDLRVAEANIGIVRAQGLINDAEDGTQATVLMIGAIIVTNTVLAFRFSYSMTSRIGKLKRVSDKLSMGEIEGLHVEIMGNDEITELGMAIRGVIAAFNTILYDAIEDEVPAVDYQTIDTPVQDLEVS